MDIILTNTGISGTHMVVWWSRQLCVGIAIFYSNLCHAAGLPCKFIRMDPEILDHTISYIPDINGNAYYIDVTEDMFFMSEESNIWNPLDKKCEFAKVDKDCTDGSYDYKGINGGWLPSKIKELWQKNVSFDKWFEEWALHKNTTKKFRTKYVEGGSGVPATDPRYKTAAYTDPAYPSNFTDTPDVWFLDDFYRFRSSEDETKVDTEELKQKIINKQFDDMLLNISEIKPNYDIDTNKQDAEAQLKAAVEADISKVKYFPASDENGKVVAMSAELTKGTDYEVSCEIKNDSSAIVKITGNGDYSDTYEKEVTLNTAVVTEPPVRIENLVYNGKTRELIKPGKAENGTMEYALGTATEPPADEEFSEDIPTGTDAGKYYVWYRAKGYGIHYDSQPQLMKPQARIKPQPVEIIAEGAVIKVGETHQLTPKLSIEGLDAQFTFYNDALGVTDVDENGLVRGIKPGVSHITISAAMESSQTNYEPEDETYVTVQVVSDERSTDPAVTCHSITYDLNGGELDGKTGTVEISCEEGSIITLPAPVRDGYIFDYWKGSRYEAGDEYTVKGDHTFTAQWVKDTGGSKKDSGKSSKTGDETNLISLMALLFASAGTLGAVSYRRRRNS